MQMDDLDEYHTFVVHLYLREEEGTEDPPWLTLSAFEETGQVESTIPVLKQCSYTGEWVITSALANRPCSGLGIDRVSEELDTLRCALYISIIKINTRHLYWAQGLDFGTTYAYLRPYPYSIATYKPQTTHR